VFNETTTASLNALTLYADATFTQVSSVVTVASSTGTSRMMRNISVVLYAPSSHVNQRSLPCSACSRTFLLPSKNSHKECTSLHLTASSTPSSTSTVHYVPGESREDFKDSLFFHDNTTVTNNLNQVTIKTLVTTASNSLA
jgi:hypothetical protein